MLRTILIRLVGILTIAALSSATLTACSEPPPPCCIPSAFEGDALILVSATHANVPAPGLPESLQPLVHAAIEQEVPIAVIGLDGSPEVALTIPAFDITRANPAATADDIRGYEAQIVAAVRDLDADSDGSDLAASFFVGRDQAIAFGATAPVFVIVDSGVSDSGAVALTRPGVTLGDAATIAGEIVATERLPRLAAHVYLVGFGYVAQPQADLSPRQRENVTLLWKIALEGMGATVTVLPEPRSGDGPDTSFTTQLVEVAEEPDIALTSDPLVFGEGSSLAFLAEQASFVDPAAASTTLDEIAAWLAADDARSATITGTTARAGTLAEQKALGAARVAAVADALIERGVADAQIVRVSVGSEWAGYTPDHRADGSVDEAAAALNRTTQIQLSAG